MFKIKLKNGVIINISNIKQLHKKPKKLYCGFGKTIKTHYCIEFNDGNFIEIDKKEYKMLKGILKKVKE